MPPFEIRQGATSAQVISEFTYRACREFRTSKSKIVYHVVESVPEGEYIHMIPPYGQTAIDPNDYRFNIQSAYQTCLRIRADVVNQAIPQKLSRCASQ